jgi:hypothetical protein
LGVRGIEIRGWQKRRHLDSVAFGRRRESGDCVGPEVGSRLYLWSERLTGWRITSPRMRTHSATAPDRGNTFGLSPAASAADGQMREPTDNITIYQKHHIPKTFSKRVAFVRTAVMGGRIVRPSFLFGFHLARFWTLFSPPPSSPQPVSATIRS